MTTQVGTKVRLVRCPRCRKVLAELPDIQVYECGGCGTILQAKSRKLEANNAELSSQETDSAPESQQDNVLEQKKPSSSFHDLPSSPKAAYSPHEANIRCQDEQDGCMGPCQYRSVSDGLSSSADLTRPPSEDSPTEVEESLDHSPLGQNPKRYQGELQDDNGERTAGPDFSNELPSSGEISLEDEACTAGAAEHVKQQNQNHLHQDNRVYKKEDGESQSVWQVNLADEVQNLPEHEDQESVSPERIKDNFVPLENDEKSRTCSADQSREFNGGIKHAGLDSLSGIISHENDVTSPSAEQVDDGSEGLSIFRSSSRGKNMTPSPRNSVLASQSPLNGSLVSFRLTSDEEHLDDSPREVSHNFERVSSIDTLGSSHLADRSSELNFKNGSMTNYPLNGSYHAYYGSESSYDGTDDHIHQHISHAYRKNKDMDYIRTTEMLRKNGFRGDNVVNSEPERTYWATSSSHRAVKNSHWSRGKSIETNRYRGGNRMRLGIQGDVSGLPFTSRDPLAGQRTISTSGHQHNLLPPRPGFNLSDKPSYLEPDKIDLLRTVCELKDQLNRMHLPKVTSNRRFPDGIMDGKFTPFHYDPLAPDREIYADLGHPGGYNPRHTHAKGCAERCNVSRLAFSGEAAHYRHQLSCSCLHCCPQDWHYSAQLPSHSMHCKKNHHVVHTDHCCNISNSLSPQHYRSSELSLWGRETKSDNQRLDEVKRLHLKEKYHMAKRHLRPIAGGAPVVACYHCSELLQLPADFLLFKKRYHRLMCNACRKVLKFSLLKGTHIVPYTPGASAPPPSEADDCNDATRRRNLEPRSHSSSCQHAEPVSCSDDYGRSFCRSCSTEGEASVILPSFNQVKRNSYNRKMSSSSSYELMEDRKMKGILKEPQHKNENSLESVESVGPSSKMPKWRKETSEIEELLPPSNSPLHQLMGYSSPSQVLNR